MISRKEVGMEGNADKVRDMFMYREKIPDTIAT